VQEERPGNHSLERLTRGKKEKRPGKKAQRFTITLGERHVPLGFCRTAKEGENSEKTRKPESQSDDREGDSLSIKRRENGENRGKPGSPSRMSQKKKEKKDPQSRPKARKTGMINQGEKG